MAGGVLPRDQGEGEGPGVLRALVVAAHPDLAGATFRLLTAGWDCVALDADDRVILKVPRDEGAAAALEAEARLLALVRPAVSLPVPDLRLVREPRLHSRHAKLPGGHLLPPGYAALPEGRRDRLARDLGRFLAELHGVPVARARAAGAPPEPSWPPLGEVAAAALPRLPEDRRGDARAVLDAFGRLPPDPLGEVLGHFDAHGWNMAWDHRAGRLNGLYDFGDAGIGGPHLELVAVSLLGADLAERVAAAYGREAGRALDLRRAAVMTGAWRLRELAGEGQEPDPFTLAQAAEWAGRGAAAVAGRPWAD